ncbi:hypothetical protein L6773_13120 [Rhodohalobacter sp. WB101]|uniref:Uncharacterized protein n=1 Tax=Rhodohalobacter sulfatireducens TaxID=2911366 RepID=A0ABS9KF87_9BACT|nr:hypothetical protein [Rhodohalobacter sulfatireducens]
MAFQNSFAQVTVAFDTKTGLFRDGDYEKITFDEPFWIKISDPEIISITTRFGIHDHGEGKTNSYKKRWHYRFFPREKLYDGTMIELPSSHSSTGNFTIIMQPLHPNEDYDVVFEAKRKLNLEKTAIDELRGSIAKKIDETFHYTKSVIDSLEIKNMHPEIGNLIAETANSRELFYADETRVDLSDPITQSNAYSYFQKIKNTQDHLNGQIEKICGYKSKPKLRDPGGSGYAYNFSKTINSTQATLLSDLDIIFNDSRYKTFLDTPVNTILDEKTTNNHILTILKRDLETTSVDLKEYEKENICNIHILNRYTDQLLAGQGEIKGNIVVAANNFDLTGGQLLMSAMLNLKDLKDAGGSYVVQDMTNLDHAIEIVRKWVSDVSVFNESFNDLEIYKKDFPNILEDVYTNWYSSTNIHLNTPIDTEDTPYIGVDFGVIVAPGISSTFTFQGFNIHLRPVNRRAKFSDLRPMNRIFSLDEFLKRTSISIGIAQRINNSDDSFEKLFATGSPFVGAGFRINRMIRVSGGVMFYKEFDENPVVTESITNSTWGVAASLDIELKKIGTVFGELLNF